MKIRSLLATTSAVALLLVAAGAQAASVQIAGWDHSQYLGSGAPTLDGATLADTLPGNYSALDTTGINGLGNGSEAFGTLFLDGQFGSTAITGGLTTGELDPITPVGGSLTSNVFPPGALALFDSLASLNADGQNFENLLSMSSNGDAVAVYKADVSTTGDLYENWTLDLAGSVFAVTGSSASVGVEFSTDGVNFDPLASLDLTDVDAPFTRATVGGAGTMAFFRLTFEGGGAQEIIDNVSISADLAVPEPGAVLLFLGGVAGLWTLGRRRA